MEFTSADIFQHSPFGDILNSLKSLSLSGESWPNYVRLEWEAGDEEIHSPPTTHLIATVDDLTDMLDFDSEDIDGMDDDVGENKDHRPQDAGLPLHHTIYTWWIHPKKTTARNGRMQRRIVPSRSNQSDDVGAAPNPASAKTAITAQERIIPRSTPKETTTTWTQRWSRMSQRTANIV